MNEVVRVACVQAESVVFDREATIDKLAALAREAAAGGAKLALFPETFVPVYPSNRWARELAHGSDGAKLWARLAQESVTLPSERLAAAARDAGIWLAVGVNELERGTIYNSLLLYAPDGTLALHHRKLVPTNHERLVWGQGDGRGLDVVQTDAGLAGGLICWENLMPLARFALYERGVETYLAPTADDSEGWQDSLRHIARESRAFVLSCCVFQSAASYPDDVPLAAGDELARTRRLGDPRTRRRLPRRTALGRGGHPLRRSRSGAPVRGASAFRPGRPLPSARRAVAHGHAEHVSSACVVGAGVFGASLARELALRGWDVTLVEQHSPGTVRSASGGDTRLLRAAHGDAEWYTASAVRARSALARARGVDGHADLGRRRPGMVRAARRRVRGRERPDSRAPRGRARVARARRRARALPLARRRRPARRALRARRRRAACAARDAAARRGRRAARRDVPGRARRPGRRSTRRRRRLGLRRLAPAALPRARRGRGLATRRLLPRRRPGVAGSARLRRLRRRLLRARRRRRPRHQDRARLGERHDRPGHARPHARRRTGKSRRARYAARRFPSLAGAPVLGGRVCQYDLSSDTHFVVDRHPERDRWWLVGGGSGHSFKHGPALAEYVADCIEGKREREPFHALGTARRRCGPAHRQRLTRPSAATL